MSDAGSEAPQRQFRAARAMALLLRVAVLVLESQGLPVTGLALAVLEIVFLSTTALLCWAGFLILYIVLVVCGVGATLQWYDALLIARVVLFSALLYRNRLFSDRRYVRRVLDWCSRGAALVIACSFAGVLVFVFRAMVRPPHQVPAALACAASLLYVSTRCYKGYLARGGRPIRKLLGRVGPRDLAISAATIALCLIGFELFLRTFIPQAQFQPGGYYRLHPTRLFDIRPYAEATYQSSEFSAHFVTNSRGLKDYEIEPKRAATFRVLCVGDSFTMGHGVVIEQTIPKQLEKVVRNEHPEASIEAVNFAIGGYGTVQQLSKVREEGFALKPDLVVLQFFPENDIRDNLRMVGKFMRSSDIGWQRHLDRFVKEQTPVTRLRNFLRKQSHAFVFLYRRWSVLQMKYLSHMSEEKDYPAIPGRPWLMETCLKEYYPELEEGWRITETCLREFRDECYERGIPFYAYAVPARYELGSKMARVMVNITSADPELYDFSTNSRRSTQMLEHLGIPTIGLRSVLLQTQHPERYYWKHDSHMNAAGYLLVAELLKPVVWKEYCRWKERASDRVQQTEAKP